MKKLIFIFLLFFSTPAFAQLVNVSSGSNIVEYVPTSYNSPGNETSPNAFDGSASTKYLNFDKQNMGVGIRLTTGRPVSSVGFITANDSAGRDPMTFSLFGSNDGVTWFIITQNTPTQVSTNRYAQSPITILSNTTAYAYYFIHAFAPPIISSLIIWNHWRQLNILLFAAILVGFINYYFKIDEYIVLIYYIAIGLLLRQGYLLTKKRSIEMYRAVVYVAIAIDLFATMLILPLKFTSYDWHESQLIQYVQYLRLSIFLSTSIILHVKLRRFIVA